MLSIQYQSLREQHVSAAPRESSKATRPQNQEEIQVEVRRHKAAHNKMFQKGEANPLLRPNTTAKYQTSILEHPTVRRNCEMIPRLAGSFQGHHQFSRYQTPEKAEEKANTTPGTGANSTPIGSRGTSKQTTPAEKTTPPTLRKPRDTTPLATGKPGRIQRICVGEGYWETGPKNTADIETTSRSTSVQVLITGCPTIPARGDEWKRSFLAGFNARRECLTPETPIFTTHVSFAFFYSTE
ncbi:hypothetical protein L211DRAFT_870165 [Terfezia boudieri ATCC MYA-4762]|uniref:Uncharacterized protein n=1 Tax=Terfezia boudieri ATCC MYA-4762 TaxID=1051890 RepID=A0A3N4LT65_9PEZI|nr:hypothetical protein L211DRAFT_870165 [Terfezia boudieri ATCC MYA-4762]